MQYILHSNVLSWDEANLNQKMGTPFPHFVKHKLFHLTNSPKHWDGFAMFYYPESR